MSYLYGPNFAFGTEGDGLYHIMFVAQAYVRCLSRLEQINALRPVPLINRLTPILINILCNDVVLYRDLFQIDYLSTINGEVVGDVYLYLPITKR
ncbi:MAG: hypothetical protein ACR5K7_01210 [Symbiopectobacterium sp.]